MKKNIFVVVLAVFIMIGFSGFVSFTQETSSDSDLDYVADYGDEAEMNWTKKVLRVKGNGFGPERVKEPGRRKILAKRAAEMDAYRNLVEVVKGVHVTSNTRVEDMMLESDSVCMISVSSNPDWSSNE